MKQNGMSTRDTWQNLQIVKIPDGGRPRHFENRKIAISHCFDEIRYTIANVEADYSHVTNWNFENRFFGNNSSTDCPISEKFCSKTQNGMPTKVTQQKIQIFKIQNGGRPPFWKLLHRHISVKKCPILMKFGTLQQILDPITITWPKIEIFKIQNGDGLHLENRFLGYNSLNGRPISAKFCKRKQNGMPTKATWQKLQIFKIQHGGRPPFWKSLNYHIAVKILLDFDKIWRTTADIKLMRFSKALSQYHTVTR